MITSVATVSSKTAKQQSFAAKIANKKSIIHFVPNRLKELTGMKKVKFNNHSLKTAKIFELINMIISKYHFQKENRKTFKLSSVILRENFGTHYNWYMDFLVEQKVLKVIEAGRANISCTSYRINPDIFKEGFTRFANTDKIVIKNWQKRALNNAAKVSSAKRCINSDVKKKLIEDLFYVDIDFKSACSDLNNMRKNGELDDVKFHKNFTSISSIENGDIFFNEDNYGRFHTNFTTLKKVIRSKYLTIEGCAVEELDITNSQPMFLCVLLKENDFHIDYPDEYKFFYNLVRSGKIYEEFVNQLGISRKTAKELIYTVLFGQQVKEKKDQNHNKYFKTLFPNIWSWLLLYKKAKKNYKQVSWDLQERESRVIFDQICYDILQVDPSIRLFTVHDSLFFPIQHKSVVQNIFYRRVNQILKSLV